MDESILTGKKHIHFIGIGGSGIFPLVQILHSQGYGITGSDNNETDTVVYERREMGIPVVIGHSAENINGADLIVYTSAILPGNEELEAAFASGVPCLERSDLLGLLTNQCDNCICVSGTHGKTTVTSMMTQIALEAGLDPSAVIGGKLEAIHGSGRAGSSGLMVCESCEFCDHFLKLFPDVAVVLNIDADHMDYFGTLENAMRSFRIFAEKATRVVIYNHDDANTCRALEGIDRPTITFGWDEASDYYPANIQYNKGVHSEFDLMHHGECLAHLDLKVPGRHNILNTVASCAAALYVGAKPEQLHDPMWAFGGAGRRFEITGHVGGVTFVDDYAHHPKELEVTLHTAKEMDFRQVWAVFQPFTFSRTAMLLDDFVAALSIADRVVLSDIMGGREVNTYGIHTSDLADRIPGSVWFHTFEEISAYVLANAQEGDLVITLGCGDVNKCNHLMVLGHLLAE